MNQKQKIGLVVGPLVFLLLYFLQPIHGDLKVNSMAGIALWMAVWWILEALPLAITSLLPMVAFPVFGVVSGKQLAPVYMNRIIFMYIGGFLIALTMEKWMLHKRIALKIISWIGGGPDRIVLGFMVAAAFLSMWISNIATTLMMFPIGMAIILQLEEEYSKKQIHTFSIALLLGIAYSCSVGGMATFVGTAPNMAFARIFTISFPSAPAITFSQWFLLGLPLSIIFIAIIWVVLTKIFYPADEVIKVEPETIKKEYDALGPISYEEKWVLFVFTLTVILWIFRSDLNLGFINIPGWSGLLSTALFIDDGTIAIFTSFLLFLIPSKKEKKATLATPDLIKKIPWDIILLFGGGFALALGVKQTGLSLVIGKLMTDYLNFSPIFLVLFMCLGLTFLTELTSNTATTQMILPILASTAIALKINPLLLMIPATLSASCAFMMPVATPPNAVIFGSKRIKIKEMVRPGIIINLLGIVIITILFYTLGVRILGLDLSTLPAWVK